MAGKPFNEDNSCKEAGHNDAPSTAFSFDDGHLQDSMTSPRPGFDEGMQQLAVPSMKLPAAVPMQVVGAGTAGAVIVAAVSNAHMPWLLQS